MNTRANSIPGTVLLAQKRQTRRIVRVALVMLLVIILLGGVAIGGISFYFSNAILQVVHYLPTYSLAVTGVSASTVTLQRKSDRRLQESLKSNGMVGRPSLARLFLPMLALSRASSSRRRGPSLVAR